MKRDVLAIVEAAYTTAPTLDGWMGALVAAAGPVLDHGLGVNGHVFAIGDDDRVTLAHGQHGYGAIAPGLMHAGQALLDALSEHPSARRVLPEIYPRAPRAGTFSELAGGLLGDFAAQPSVRRVAGVPADAVSVIGGDPSGRGIVLLAGTPAAGPLAPRRRALWTRVAAHLASAYRLQRVANDASVDAVLHPDGRVAHAEPAAQSPASLASLRAGARAMDTARGRLRRADPDEALALWKDLVAGQWSLVDQVDSDGRRYVFARRNPPAVHAWGALGARQREVLAYAAQGHSHKTIGYALGISTATVSTHLRRAAITVGVGSRLALVRAFNARAGSTA